MGTKFLHQAIELVAILTLGEGEIIFLKSVTTAKVTDHSLAGNPTFEDICATQIGLGKKK